MQNVFGIIILACSIIGILSAARIATLLVRSRVVSALDMTKIGTAAFIFTALSLFVCAPKDYFYLWLQVQIPLLIGIASAFLLAKYRERAVEDSIDEVLSRLMMRMKEGRSFTMALELVASETQTSIRLRWIEIARSVSFSQQKNLQNSDRVTSRSHFLPNILIELRRIESLSRSQIPEIERWRSRIRSERSFRRRSMQAMAQVRAQSIILLTIYAVLAIFSVLAFGWDSTRGSFQLSMPLFAIALVSIWRGGKRVKWSV